MELRIAIAGNPNCGKTTLFNALTGSNQYVGNWPGVTVEKKEGSMKKIGGVTVTDLPGIYSLSPYTMEEVVARKYLVDEQPDAILNIVDGTNLERNLYLTTQLTELGIPVVIAINMMDIVRKNGDSIDIDILSKQMGCPVVEISALKGDGIDEAAEKAVEAAKHGKSIPPHIFSGEVEHVLAHIEEAAIHHLPEEQQRWYAIKLFERDSRVIEKLGLDKDILSHIENDIKFLENLMDDDAEGIITNERYLYIEKVVSRCCSRKRLGHRSLSDRIDSVLTNRILALPIFAVVMLGVYALSIGTVGDWTVGFMNETLFGEWIIPGIAALLEGIGCAEWLVSLVANGIVGGVGSVLGFVPQMLILFLLLSILEDVGYMSRIAFIMDKIFRKFGLSGQSFIPMLVATGCGVPGIMASRTIETESDRRMTVMTTGFIPCGAKMPIVGMIAGALFGGSPWIAVTAYFSGVAAVIVSGLILKKTKPFAGKPAPFVMELPAYHAPVASNILRTTWDRGWGFVKRAGSVIVMASMIIWVLNSLSFEGGLHYITEADGGASILSAVGGVIAVIFRPLGFGQWQAAVATVLGLLAKEEVVGVFGSLGAVAGMTAEAYASHIWDAGAAAGLSFLLFNLLCAPCFAAMGAIRREMNDWRWTAFAIGYMCAFAYAVSFMVYQFGTFFSTGVFTLTTALAVLVLLTVLALAFRKGRAKA